MRFWAGGGNILQSAPSKTNFGGLRKWDSSGLCPFPLRTMTGREQTGGGGEHVQKRCWSPEFSTPPLQLFDIFSAPYRAALKSGTKKRDAGEKFRKKVPRGLPGTVPGRRGMLERNS